MPIGRLPRALPASGPTIVPRDLPTADASLVDQLGAGEDLWEHEVIDPIGTTPVALDVATPATKIDVLVREEAQVFVGLGRTPTPASYDLVVDGPGYLEFNIPPSRHVELVADASLGTPVDVWLLGGTMAARP
jgi:hypothetical protein